MAQYEKLKAYLKEFQMIHNRPMVFAIDFDGTLCEEAYPGIGEQKVIMLLLVKTLQQLGAYTILWTCRSGQHLDNAKQWCADRDLIFDKYNEHADCFLEMYDCQSPKIFADMYIDDKAHSALYAIKGMDDLLSNINKIC